MTSQKKVEVEVFVKKMKGREDSFWYADQDIARFEYKGRVVVLIATGDIRVVISNKMGEDVGEISNRNIDEAEFFGIDNDKDLNRKWISKNRQISWENNNWFECICSENDGDTFYDTMGDVAHDYTSAMKIAKKLIFNDLFWLDHINDLAKDFSVNVMEILLVKGPVKDIEFKDDLQDAITNTMKDLIRTRILKQVCDKCVMKIK